MLNKIKEKMLYAYVALRSFWEDKKGADMVEWAAIIALVAGVVIALSPTVRKEIKDFFTEAFKNLGNLSAGTNN